MFGSTPLGHAAAGMVLAENSVGAAQIKKNAVTGAKVKNGTLLAADFKRGQLPRGRQGLKGDTGGQGPKGDTGAQGPKGDKGDPGAATGPAGGDSTGSYPDPQLGAGKVTPTKISGIPAARITRGSSNQTIANN